MVKGILFDKDGTLIDFFELWLGAAKWAIPRMMEENSLSEDLENYILETIGVKKGMWIRRELLHISRILI